MMLLARIDRCSVARVGCEFYSSMLILQEVLEEKIFMCPEISVLFQFQYGLL